jgi:hypothetical protein
MVEGIPLLDRVEEVCDGCVLGKHQRHSFPQVANYRAKKGLELVHVDLCGQIRPKTHSGKSYFLLTVDDFSRFMWVELLSTKDEAFKCFKRVKALAETERNLKLRVFRSDHGGEFNSIEFKEYCDKHGIKHFTTAQYTPQQNGVVERRNRTVVEMARCLLKSKGLPAEFWGEAVSTAVYLLNRALTKSLQGRTPYEAWYNKKPKVHHLRTFGIVVYVKNIGPGISKLTDRSTKMVFVGYENGTKAYRVYDPAAKKLHISRDVIFEEGQAWDWKQEENTESVGSVFDVEFYSALGPRIATEEIVSEGEGAGMLDDTTLNSPVPGEWNPSGSSQEGSAPHTPEGSTTHGEASQTPQLEWSSNSEGVPIGYRNLSDLYDTTEEIHDFEYSGVCFHATEEPRTVDEALTGKVLERGHDG